MMDTEPNAITYTLTILSTILSFSSLTVTWARQQGAGGVRKLSTRELPRSFRNLQTHLLPQVELLVPRVQRPHRHFHFVPKSPRDRRNSELAACSKSPVLSSLHLDLMVGKTPPVRMRAAGTRMVHVRTYVRTWSGQSCDLDIT